MVTGSSKSGTATQNSSYFKKAPTGSDSDETSDDEDVDSQCFNPKQPLTEILGKPVTLGEQESVQPDTARSCNGEAENI